jgi:signal transduction histidine kinase
VTRKFLLVWLPACALCGAAVLLFYVLDRAATLRGHERDGVHAVRLQAELIRHEYEAVRSDLLVLAGSQSLGVWVAAPAADRLEAVGREFLGFARCKGLYDQVRFIDAQGAERVRVNLGRGRPVLVAPRDLQAKSGRYYVSRALALPPGGVYVSPLDLNVESDRIERPPKPVVRVATPVDDPRGRRAGIVVLNYLGARLLQRFEDASRHFDGSLWLVNRQGHWLRGPCPEDEWGFMLGHGRSFARAHPQAWSAVARGESGQLLTAGGLFTFEAPRPRSGTESDGLRVIAFTAAAALGGRSAALLVKLVGVWTLAAALLGGFALALAHLSDVRRRALERLERAEARLRSLSGQLLVAQEHERRRLSRDLHDDVGQIATAVCLDLERAQNAAGGDRGAATLSRALQGARSILDRIRAIALELRPAVLDDLGLRDAVESHVAEFEARTGIEVIADLAADPAPGAIPAPVADNLFRILQEALTNVEKHACTARVRVELRVSAGLVALRVADEGVGFDPVEAEGRSLGLLSMRERAGLLGGAFGIDTVPGGGTTVRVEVPSGRAGAEAGAVPGQGAGVA